MRATVDITLTISRIPSVVEVAELIKQAEQAGFTVDYHSPSETNSQHSLTVQAPRGSNPLTVWGEFSTFVAEVQVVLAE